MTTTAKTIVRATLDGTAESHSRTLLKVRDLIDISDEPAARGGTNEGFAPTELLIAALVSCTNVISHKIAAKHGIPIDALAIQAVYDFDRRGVTLSEEVRVPFPRIELEIRVTTSADESAIALLERELPKFCAVSKVIAESGTEIVTKWVVERPG